eukprot:jgi/Botrbrau1/8140/Bobra.0308s0030.1
MQTLRGGLLQLLPTMVGLPDDQELKVFVLWCLHILLLYPEAVQLLREATMWPALLLDLCACRMPVVVLAAAHLLREVAFGGSSHLAVEAVAGGALQRLKASQYALERDGQPLKDGLGDPIADEERWLAGNTSRAAPPNPPHTTDRGKTGQDWRSSGKGTQKKGFPPPSVKPAADTSKPGPSTDKRQGLSKSKAPCESATKIAPKLVHEDTVRRKDELRKISGAPGGKVAGCLIYSGEGRPCKPPAAASVAGGQQVPVSLSAAPAPEGTEAAIPAFVDGLYSPPDPKAFEAAAEVRDRVLGAAPEPGGEGSLRALLRISNVPNLSATQVENLYSPLLDVLLTDPTVPDQLVSAISDPDPAMVFAATQCCIAILGEPRTSSQLLGAGVAPALVKALAHPHPYCRSVAAIAATTAQTPELVMALVRAGLVPAMLKVVGEGAPREPPGPMGSGVFSSVQVRLQNVAGLLNRAP